MILKYSCHCRRPKIWDGCWCTAEGRKKKQNISRHFLQAMNKGDFVTVCLAIGLDHENLIEVNNPTDMGMFNITLEEKLKERCMKWGADHSIKQPLAT